MTKSIYTNDGSYIKGEKHVETVGELKALLAAMPDELPLSTEGMWLTWVNVGREQPGMQEHLSFDDDVVFGDDD